MEVNGDDIIFLLGAGASYDAGIPISVDMVKKIEKLIDTDDDWKPYKDLYFYLKSSINYADGIMGKFEESFNVERLLIVITEIQKRDRNIMYPFIGAWNIRLLDLAGPNFNHISNFQKLIRKQLNEWVRIKNYEQASYYESFNSISGEIGSLLKVFTLNYDLCFERIVGKEKNIESGFSSTTKDWHYSNFDNIHGKHFFLYKLHGSIDWYTKEDENNKLYISDDPVEKPELIFGIMHKMTSVDPYFYYSSKLREACFANARLIIVIGYSFTDEYINVILSQALQSRQNLFLLNISPSETEDGIQKKLGISVPKQIKSEKQTAKDFMKNIMNLEYLKDYIKEADDAPF